MFVQQASTGWGCKVGSLLAEIYKGEGKRERCEPAILSSKVKGIIAWIELLHGYLMGQNVTVPDPATEVRQNRSRHKLKTTDGAGCRVCQEEKEEHLIDLGFECQGGIAEACWSCIGTWFHIRGSNKCEVCQQVAINVPPLALQPSVLILHLLEQTFRMEVVSTSYLVWRVDPTFTGSTIAEERKRGCFSPLWVAVSTVPAPTFGLPKPYLPLGCPLVLIVSCFWEGNHGVTCECVPPDAYLQDNLQVLPFWWYLELLCDLVWNSVISGVLDEQYTQRKTNENLGDHPSL
ncbi:hypothetical protein RHMOL_Rhmol02G0317600 [Rhododendron molle]|uniref:Uncharacterized protein n=1 Tax=Rhododendron molle TaxID=49168 RepID=A0ACC0PXQ4_RHOML|nr:hypothetical protein RHMOL_Rhmol02G0317600 [Rhododendron molle]